jgi:hypothetical protein
VGRLSPIPSTMEAGQVGFLEKAEERIESSVSTLFSKFSKAELQPVEITQAVRTAMDQAAANTAQDRVLVPNKYLIIVSVHDSQRISPAMLQAIKTEIARHAARQNYRLAADLDLEIQADKKVLRGQLKVGFTSIANSIAWQPTLIVNGERMTLKLGTTTVGRDESSDLVIDDRGLSRIHFELAWNGEVAAVRDRQSTNGTFLDGARISEAVLRSGSKITAGRSEFEFELLAIAEGIS